MAILSFSITKREFLSGRKTVTRRVWSKHQYEMWVRMWEQKRLVHDAWDNVPRAGGKKIGQIQLTAKPYKQRLRDMRKGDLIVEGGFCDTVDEFCEIIGRSPGQYVTVVEFAKL